MPPARGLCLDERMLHRTRTRGGTACGGDGDDRRALALGRHRRLVDMRAIGYRNAPLRHRESGIQTRGLGERADRETALTIPRSALGRSAAQCSLSAATAPASSAIHVMKI
jgi:hypothetical protein